MLTLCGFSASNYYNKVKLALLEKDVPFEEKQVWTDRSPALLEKSPLGKVPFFEIDGKVLFESQVMLDYVESAYPQKPLIPADPYEAARNPRPLYGPCALWMPLPGRKWRPLPCGH